MKRFRIGAIMFVVAIAAGGLATAEQQRSPARPPQSATSSTPARDAALKDIEKTFGFVPQFLREIPAGFLPTFWEGMKTFQMSTTTKLDLKTKELIGLAVSSQIPCEYCIEFHTEAAKRNGATPQEIEEAVAMAAMTRMGSTLLNGLQVDRTQFKRDLDRVMHEGRSQARK